MATMIHRKLAYDVVTKRAIYLNAINYSSKRVSKPRRGVARQESVFGTKNYSDALQRAFNNVKQQIFFNPDMNLFITLTYKGKDQTLEQVQHDIKMLIKKEQRLDSNKQIKYVYIMEYQKRGSIHVHMIANQSFTLNKNKNNYLELTHWKKGFSSVLTIKDFDNNFKPYLYLFKYMKKSQRIGKSFVHTSRNLNNFQIINDPDPTHLAKHWNTINQEHFTYIIPNSATKPTKIVYDKKYLCYDDTNNISIEEITCQTKLE